MSILDRDMFRKTSVTSPDVTVIGESGGGVRPKIDMPPPSAKITLPGFERPEFEVNPIIGGLTLDTNVDPNIPDTSNQIVLSTGEVITIDPEKLKNIVNSDAIFTLDVFGMLNNPKVTLGSNVRSILEKAMDNRRSSLDYDDYIGGVGNFFADAQLFGKAAFERAGQTAEDIANFFGENIDTILKNPQLRGLYKKELEKEQMDRIAAGEIPEYKPFDFFESPLREGGLSPQEALFSGMRSPKDLDEMYRGAQLQSEIEDLDKPSQTDMESDVAEELPTVDIAANVIETQEDPTTVSEGIDTQADLERRIKEGQSQMALDKIDRESLTEKEKEDRIREDIEETEFEVSKKQQDKFFADEQKYIKDLALAETFGGQKFKDYLGSIGKQLVKTGSFMGIPFGTADFVESEEGKRAAEAEAEIELTKEQIKQTGKDTGPSVRDLKTIKDASTEFNQHSGDFQGARAAVVLIDEVLALVDQAKQAGGAQLGGLLGYYDLAKDSLLAALNIPNEPSAATTVANTLKVLQNRNIREILGESGRTISNVDRDIVKGVFGEFTLTTNIETVEKKLKESRNALITNMNKYKANMQSTFDFLQETGQYGQRQALAGSEVMMDAIRFDPSVRQSNQGKLKGESLLDTLNKVTEIDL